MTILAPAAASFKAIAFPMPLLPPVIKTVFPCNDIIYLFKKFITKFNKYYRNLFL
jgi:hypothetical protein